MWRVEFTPKADKQFSKLDRPTQQSIVEYLERILTSDDPRNFGKALMGDPSGFRRYRVGKCRLICDIQEQQLIIELISIAKRDSVYN